MTIFRGSRIAALALMVLSACGSSSPPVNASPANTTYVDVPWAKLFNPAFSADYEDKGVQFEAMWVGPAKAMMHMSAGFEPWSKMVQVGVVPVGTTKGPMGYDGAQWSLYLPKDGSDQAFALQEGATVRVFARGSVFRGGSALGGNAQHQFVVLTVDRLEAVATQSEAPVAAPNEAAAPVAVAPVADSSPQ